MALTQLQKLELNKRTDKILHAPSNAPAGGQQLEIAFVADLSGSIDEINQSRWGGHLKALLKIMLKTETKMWINRHILKICVNISSFMARGADVSCFFWMKHMLNLNRSSLG